MSNADAAGGNGRWERQAAAAGSSGSDRNQTRLMRIWSESGQQRTISWERQPPEGNERSVIQMTPRNPCDWKGPDMK